MRTSLFLGIGGAGMRGLALLLESNGEVIIGFDDNHTLSPLSLAQALEKLSTCDRVVYTDAALATHPLREAATTAGIACVPYQKALGEFSKNYTTIAVTGTHGKSSTTAFLSHICSQAGLDPNVLVGASLPAYGGKNAHAGKGKYFIVEADEYRRHFLELSPHSIIITSIDFDHPDAFTSLDDVEHAYGEFISRIHTDGVVVIPQSEYEAHPNVAWPEEPSRVITVPSSDSENIHVPLPGAHMKQNGALAVALAQRLGVSREDAIAHLATFPGLSRRFERIGSYKECDIISDYGHHPAEITATLSGARDMYPNRSIIAIFEPHMPLRLHTFFPQFIDALQLADAVIITEPFVPSGRDTTYDNDARTLAEALQKTGKPTTYTPQSPETAADIFAAIDSVQSNAKQKCVAIYFSAGPLDTILRENVKIS